MHAVPTPKPKRFEYAVEVDRDETMRADGTAPASLDSEWSPDHLLLAALVRCVLMSLEHHAHKAGIETAGSGSARGIVTRRETDGRYAFVEIEVGLDVELDPLPEAAALGELLDLAERDCFVGASLTAPPRYEWRVNGEVVR